MGKNQRKLWRHPWQFRESALGCCGVIIVGLALQVFTGPFQFALLRWPGNLFVLALICMGTVLGTVFRKTAFGQWLSSAHLALCLISVMLFFSLIMGLTPQNAGPHAHGLAALLGFTRMTSSWPFVLSYAFTLLVLGLVVTRRMFRFSLRDFAFYLNHLGLWIVLAAAGLGAADVQRLIMQVREGKTEWKARDQRGAMLELPLAVTLKDFAMEEYPPKLAVIERETGRVQPEGKPAFISLDENSPGELRGRLGAWELTLENYIHEAVKSGENSYVASLTPISTPAALVRAKNIHSGETKTGWICSGGSNPDFFSGLILDDRLMLLMSTPEPKRYLSDIIVRTPDGKETEHRLEVNKPLRAGFWNLYQYSYDFKAGKASVYSSIELVYDPWLYPVYFGMALMLSGGLCLVWSGAGKRRAQP
jgi:hypothetical protein